MKWACGPKHPRVKIPCPPLATQPATVAEIEAEQTLVAATRERIARFEQKSQATASPHLGRRLRQRQRRTAIPAWGNAPGTYRKPEKG
jgi:hypothetical protein